MTPPSLCDRGRGGGGGREVAVVEELTMRVKSEREERERLTTQVCPLQEMLKSCLGSVSSLFRIISQRSLSQLSFPCNAMYRDSVCFPTTTE